MQLVERLQLPDLAGVAGLQATLFGQRYVRGD